jgi:hypothetical protein
MCGYVTCVPDCRGSVCCMYIYIVHIYIYSALVGVDNIKYPLSFMYRETGSSNIKH